MSRPLRNVTRLLTIARVLARHDALFALDSLGILTPLGWALRLAPRRRIDARPGQKLAAAFTDLGPTFIKLGQALSVRSDLLGEEIAADLAELQDSLPPFPFAAVREAVEGELGAPLESLFSRFDPEPVAAASIAQVHFAETAPDALGQTREVAVKILRPGVEEAFQKDVDLLLWLARLAERMQPKTRRLRPVESAEAFANTVTIEMDLRFEAAAACEVAENFADDPTFRVPEIDWQRTGRRVMTLERVSGLPLSDRAALARAGLDPLDTVTKVSNAFFKMVFRHGFFHADMHPGNLFVQQDGTIIAVDFGIMGRVDQKTRRHLGEMLLSFLTGEYRRAAEIHFEAGWVSADQSVDAFTQACRSIAQPILGRPLNEISIARLLGQLFHVTETFDMRTQPELLLLQKSMLVTEGVGRSLAPQVNMWEMARPLIESWMADNLGPQARVRDGLTLMGDSVERLPRILAASESFFERANQGGVRLDPETMRALKGGRGSVTAALPWIVAAILALLLVFK